MRELLKNYNFLDFMYTAQERYGRMYKLRLEEEITYEKQEFLLSLYSQKTSNQ